MKLKELLCNIDKYELMTIEYWNKEAPEYFYNSANGSELDWYGEHKFLVNMYVYSMTAEIDLCNKDCCWQETPHFHIQVQKQNPLNNSIDVYNHKYQI